MFRLPQGFNEVRAYALHGIAWPALQQPLPTAPAQADLQLSHQSRRFVVSLYCDAVAGCNFLAARVLAAAQESMMQSDFADTSADRRQGLLRVDNGTYALAFVAIGS